MAAPTPIPLNIAIAPFPEGFQGDMDETFQQAVQLMEATVEGNFLVGLILPPGSTLPSSDQGPIWMGGVWYYFDPTAGQYLPQTVSAKAAKNFVKNCVYQVQQTGPTFTLGSGLTKTYDMVQSRSTTASVLAVAADVGPPASVDNDYCPAAIKYTVGPALVPTPSATDLQVHEHLIEGADIAMIQGETLSLSLSVWVNQPGTYSVYLTSGGRDASYVANFTVQTANTWTRIKIIGIPALPTTTGTWSFSEGSTGLYIGVAMLVGSQYQQVPANLNKWNAGFWAGSAANINMCTVVNNQIKISGIKLEASPQVSYLSVPSFDADLWEAIRYYYTTFTYQQTNAGISITLGAPLAGVFSVTALFPRRMAKTPSVIPFSASSYTTGQISNLSSGVDVAVASLVATVRGIKQTQDTTISTTGTIAAIALTGTLVIGLSAVFGISSIASLAVGMSVQGSGIAPGTVIDVIGSNAVVPLNGNLTAGNTGITALSSTASLAPGMLVLGTGIANGTYITTISSSTVVIMSQPAAASGTGVGLTFYAPSIFISKQASANGNSSLSFGTFAITAIPSTAAMAAGQAISGSGIQSGTTIASILSGTSVALSAPAVAFGTGVALTVKPFNKADIFWALITADARLT